MSGEIDPIISERSGNVREVGNQAIWSLSSCKPGFGVEQLRDDRTDTYWQSDGQLPHLVNIQFQRKTTISDIYIYTDYKLDESYTPSRISIRVGTHFNDLQEVEVKVLSEPSDFLRDGRIIRKSTLCAMQLVALCYIPRQVGSNPSNRIVWSAETPKFYESGILSLPEHWQNIVNQNGEFVID